MTRAGLLLLGAVLALATPTRAQPTDEGTCVSCHEREEVEEIRRPVSEWRLGVHAHAEVSCDGCHGGDPRREGLEESMSVEAGYLGTPPWSEMADFCGACHEEIATSYRQGALGRMIQQGRKPPSCANCHMRGSHEIRPPQVTEILAEERDARLRDFLDPARTREVVAPLRERERELSRRIARVARKGLDDARLRYPLGYARERYIRALHTFEVERLDEAGAIAHEELDHLAASAEAYEREADFRRRYGLLVVGTLAVMLLVLLWIRLAPGGAERAS